MSKEEIIKFLEDNDCVVVEKEPNKLYVEKSGCVWLEVLIEEDSTTCDWGDGTVDGSYGLRFKEGWEVEMHLHEYVRGDLNHA